MTKLFHGYGVAKRVLTVLLLLGTLESVAETRVAAGEALYQRCAACHLKTGKGVPGMFPPLNQRLRPLMETPLGRDYLAMVIEAGLIGSINVEGLSYRGIMPAQGAAMSNDEVAQLLNYILQTFNPDALEDNWQAYTEAEIEDIRSRYPKATGRDVHALRQRALASVR